MNAVLPTILAAALATIGISDDGPLLRPFWMKPPTSPTLVPHWLGNTGPVTRTVVYDVTKSQAENGDRLETALESLTPGDHVVIHGGAYAIDSKLLIRVAATATGPVRIRPADGHSVTIRQLRDDQNAIEIDDTSYLSIEGLTITGGSQGVRIGRADHVLLSGCRLHGFNGNAVTANTADTSHLDFVDNEIYGTSREGEGFYLGGHGGTVVTHHTRVIGNYVHDLTGPGVTQGDGIEIKHGSYACVVRGNWVQNTRYPGIIAYGTGRGAEGRNVIEQNVVLASGDNAIQVSGEAIIRSNLVVTPGTAFQSKPEATRPSQLTVVNNTFVSGGRSIGQSGWDEVGGETITVVDNALVSRSGNHFPNGNGRAKLVGNVLLDELSSFAKLAFDGTTLDARPVIERLQMGSKRVLKASPADLFGRPLGRAVGAVAATTP